LLAGLAATVCPASRASTINVPADKPTIQSAINASSNGDTVVVAKGTYNENIDFLGKAITVISAAGPAATIIQGDGTTAVVVFHNGETRASVINGFTIQGGGGELDPTDYGGGIDVVSATPTILNNIVTNNLCHAIAVNYGGALIQGNTVSNTSSSSNSYCIFNGSGIVLAFNNNPASVVIGNTITHNQQAIGYDGGGILMWAVENTVVESNVFSQNATTGQGGGITSYNTDAMIIAQNLFYENTAAYGAGAVSILAPSASQGPFFGLIQNNTFVGNTVSQPDQQGSISASQVYLEGNLAPYEFTDNVAIGADVHSVFVCGQTYNYLSATPVVVDHNDIFNSGGPGYGGACPDQTGQYGNISADPMFKDAAANDYHLLLSSPAVDNGNNSALQLLANLGFPLPGDLDGNPRVQNATGKSSPIIDMGAYEYPGVHTASPTTVVLNPSAYDITGEQSLTLTANLYSPLGAPVGTVTFLQDDVEIGTATIDATGAATLSVGNGLVPGTYAFLATYPGQGGFTPCESVKIYVIVGTYGVTLKLASSPNPSKLGQSVTFQTNISAKNGVPPGTISLTDSSTSNTLATLTPDSNGNASFSTSTLTAGSHLIQAYYGGNTNDSNASASVTQVVQNGVASGIPTTTALTASATTLTAGQSLTLTATVAAASGATPTGTVTFLNGATSLGTGALNASGVATLTLTPAVGAYLVTAGYGGSTTDAASVSSPPIVVTVGNVATTTALTASATNLTAGQSVTLTATVTAATGPIPNGFVTFLNGATSLGTVALLPSGVATLTLTPAVGSYSITASYAAYVDWEASVSPSISITVTGVTTNSPNIYTYAGTGTQGFSGDGGPAMDAEVSWPAGEAMDADGNLYFADIANSRIRRIDAATGIITTIAGNGQVSYGGDGGPALDAAFSSPQGVSLDAAANIYIADDLNNRVRKIDATTGIITTLAGTGTAGFSGDGGPASAAELHGPTGVASDAAGNVYISELGNNRIRRVDGVTGIITTVAGNGGSGFAGDGGPATSATLWAPYGVGLDAAGSLYIMDSANNRVRKVDHSTAIITTVAGNGAQGFSGDGGPATSASLNSPSGDFAITSAGDIYFEDGGNNRVRRVDGTTGVITTFAGDGVATYGGDGGPANLAEIDSPNGVVFDSSGNLYIGDTFNMRIRIVGKLPQYRIATTTTLAASATTLDAGQSLTLTATVTAATGLTPTGTVTFLNGTAPLGTGTLDADGIATLTLTPAPGTYSITASYAGSTTDAPSTSAPPITVTVGLATTTTALVATPTSMPFGQSVALTATVTAAGGPTPTGVITFLNGTTSLGAGTLNASGVATLTLGLPGAGVYSITASYPGSTTDGPSVSSPVTTVTVTPAATTTSVTSSLNPAPFGAAVTFNAIVAVPNATTGTTPTGSISFYDGSGLLSTATLTNGNATYSTSELSVGSHSITAAYTATANFSASTSGILTQVIDAATFTLSASPGSQTLYTGQAATYTATVTPGPGFNLPVALSCSQLPANTTCNFSPATVNSNNWSSTLTVQTTAPGPTTNTASSNSTSSKLGAISLAGLLLLLLPRRLRHYRKGWHLLLLAFAALSAFAAITACAGPSAIGGGTPVGSQTITITAAATNGSQSLTQTTTVTLNVQSLF